MQKQATIKNIIFDFGNVIIKANFDYIASKFSNNPSDKKFIKENIFYSPEWMGLGLVDTGLLSFEDMALIINDRTNNSHTNLVNNVLNNVTDMFVYNENILDIIKSLKNKGYKLYLLSNISEKVYSSFKDDLTSIFDGLVLSYEIHKIKPYNGIYSHLINTYNIKPEESLFIDDNKSNIDAAKKFNINSVCVNANDIDDIKRVLTKWGCL